MSNLMIVTYFLVGCVATVAGAAMYRTGIRDIRNGRGWRWMIGANIKLLGGEVMVVMGIALVVLDLMGYGQ